MEDSHSTADFSTLTATTEFHLHRLGALEDQLVVTSANNNREPYRLLGDDVVGRHGLGVGGLFHCHGGCIPGRLLGGLGLIGRLEPAEHFGR